MLSTEAALTDKIKKSKKVDLFRMIAHKRIFQEFLDGKNVWCPEYEKNPCPMAMGQIQNFWQFLK